MRKLLIGIFVLTILAAAAGIGGLYYIRPDAALSLEHKPINVENKALDMVKRASREMIISEEDVNNLLKKSLAENPKRSKDVEVQGARFTLAGDRLISDFKLLWKNRVPAGLQVTYRLSWQAPNLVASVEEVKLKDISLPKDTVEDITLPIGRELPKPLKIEDVAFADGELQIRFKKPNLMDLQELIG